MQIFERKRKMKHITPNKNTNIYILPSQKFKTFCVDLKFFVKMNKETAALNAVFPFVMRSGSEKYPTSVEVGKCLENCYGGIFDAGVRKKGDIQEIEFFFEFVAPDYSDENQIENCTAFIKEMLLNPLVENGAFSEKYTEIEKNNLIDYIEGIINDKKEYTAVRLIEEMFKGEPYGLYESGTKEDVEKITAQKLFEQYKKVIYSAPLSIFISGNADGEKIAEGLKSLTAYERENIPTSKLYEKHNEKPVCVTEKADTVQGKFGLGFKTGVKADSEDYFKLTLLNGVFGSGPTSKLFMNVREKMSLCYYVYSRLNRLKGIMTVFIGCDRENFRKAYDEIFNQLNMCRNGDIMDEEIANAKNFLITVLKQTNDSQRSLTEYYTTGMLAGLCVSTEEYIEKIENCTKEDIVRLASAIELEAEFYLG